MGYPPVAEDVEETDQRFGDVHRRIDDLRADTLARITDLRSDMADNIAQVHEELRQLRALLQNSMRIRGS